MHNFVKRLIDILGALFGLCGLALVFVPIALAIKLDSAGPVIFRQRRLTKNGRLFWFYKFRTMVVDATLRQVQLDKLNETTGPIFKMRDDPRVTRTGRILRRYSLDELPQFWNVLKGDMSLVGPRPPLVHEVEQYGEREKKRLQVKQGMTGLWQTSGRSQLGFEEMLNLDLYYIEHQTLRLDLKILWHTLPVVTKGVGSY